MPSRDLSVTLWWFSLAIAVVVLLAIVALLSVILRTARQIDADAKRIWLGGKGVANSTVHLAMLLRTNQILADVLEAATGILGTAGRIGRHAASCPGCPACARPPDSAGQ